ncbi:MAG TPA: hypothetical protein VIT23_17505 [Terrimicrobiaceae bacterium]
MNDQRSSVLPLLEVSRELVRNFLLINGYDIVLPKRIILYNCRMDLMTFIATAMGQDLASRNDITISILGPSVAPSIDDDAYCIDVGYFCGTLSRD